MAIVAQLTRQNLRSEFEVRPVERRCIIGKCLQDRRICLVSDGVTFLQQTLWQKRRSLLVLYMCMFIHSSTFRKVYLFDSIYFFLHSICLTSSALLTVSTRRCPQKSVVAALWKLQVHLWPMPASVFGCISPQSTHFSDL